MSHYQCGNLEHKGYFKKNDILTWNINVQNLNTEMIKNRTIIANLYTRKIMERGGSITAVENATHTERLTRDEQQMIYQGTRLKKSAG